MTVCVAMIAESINANNDSRANTDQGGLIADALRLEEDILKRKMAQNRNYAKTMITAMNSILPHLVETLSGRDKRAFGKKFDRSERL